MSTPERPHEPSERPEALEPEAREPEALAAPETPESAEPRDTPAQGHVEGKRRRWLRPLLMLAAVGTFLVVTGEVGPLASRPCEITVRLAAPHELEHVRLGYAPDGGDELRSVVFRFAKGRAPPTLRHDVDLPAGTYRLSIELGRGGATERLERRIELGEASSVVVETRAR